MQDPGKFIDMVHGIDWEEGLPMDVYTAVESYLTKGREDQAGITGEGTMTENAKGKKSIRNKTRRTKRYI